MSENQDSRARRRPKCIVLVGFMGAGKTSVGQELANVLGWAFLDVDREIERREKLSVHQIFAEKGEEHFRRVEREELERVLRERSYDCVVAVGGGAFAQEGCADVIANAGAHSVLLDAPVDELRRRVTIGDTVRPLARDRERFMRLYEERREAYECAEKKFATGGKTIPKVAREIAEWVRAELIRP